MAVYHVLVFVVTRSYANNIFLYIWCELAVVNIIGENMTLFPCQLIISKIPACTYIRVLVL